MKIGLTLVIIYPLVLFLRDYPFKPKDCSFDETFLMVDYGASLLTEYINTHNVIPIDQAWDDYFFAISFLDDERRKTSSLEDFINDGKILTAADLSKHFHDIQKESKKPFDYINRIVSNRGRIYIWEFLEYNKFEDFKDIFYFIRNNKYSVDFGVFFRLTPGKTRLKVAFMRRKAREIICDSGHFHLYRSPEAVHGYSFYALFISVPIPENILPKNMDQ